MLEIDGLAQITHHGDAIICSFETILDCGLEEAKEKVLTAIKMVEQLVNEENGLIGHIKAHIKESGRSISISTTGGPATIMNGISTETEVSFTAIVFFVNEIILREIIERQFE